MAEIVILFKEEGSQKIYKIIDELTAGEKELAAASALRAKTQADAGKKTVKSLDDINISLKKLNAEQTATNKASEMSKYEKASLKAAAGIQDLRKKLYDLSKLKPFLKTTSEMAEFKVRSNELSQSLKKAEAGFKALRPASEKAFATPKIHEASASVQELTTRLKALEKLKPFLRTKAEIDEVTIAANKLSKEIEITKQKFKEMTAARTAQVTEMFTPPKPYTADIPTDTISDVISPAAKGSLEAYQDSLRKLEGLIIKNNAAQDQYTKKLKALINAKKMATEQNDRFSAELNNKRIEKTAARTEDLTNKVARSKIEMERAGSELKSFVGEHQGLIDALYKEGRALDQAKVSGKKQ